MPISLQKKVKPKTISKILKDQKKRGKSKKCQKWRKQQFELEPKKYVTNFLFSYIELWTKGLFSNISQISLPILGISAEKVVGYLGVILAGLSTQILSLCSLYP